MSRRQWQFLVLLDVGVRAERCTLGLSAVIDLGHNYCRVVASGDADFAKRLA